jgi:dehydrogenase/reductase SDR family member 7B
MDFDNKVVWITGATSGIGEVLAYDFNSQKARLIISGRRLSELERVRNNCKSSSAEVFVLPLDLEDHESLQEKVKIALDHFGFIDILINNGGISQRALAKDAPLEVDKKIMNINYFGTIALTKALLPSMIGRKMGQIIVISSLTGKFGAPLRSAYSASKHALHGFFDSLRSEIWKENIFITMICPGYIKTNVSLNALTSNGTPHMIMENAQANGMLPEKLSKLIMKAIYKKKKEVYFGGKEVIGIYIKRYFPSLFDKIIRTQKVT